MITSATTTSNRDGEVSATPSSSRGSARAVTRKRQLERAKEVWAAFRKSKSGMFGLVMLIVFIGAAVAAPIIVNESELDPTKVNNPLNQAPSWEHPFGTDSVGRSVIALLLWGARISLTVGIAATIVSVVIGTTIGLMAGHWSGWRSSILMRVVDFFLVIPTLLLAIVLASVMQKGLWTIVIAIGVASWSGTARLVRSQTLTIETRGYVQRSKALGAGHTHIIGKHVLPGVTPLVLTSTTLAIGSAINAEATLSFLGIGSGEISWGAMLQSAVSSGAASAGHWWLVLPPGFAIVVVVLSFTLVGRAIEAIINPTRRGR